MLPVAPPHPIPLCVTVLVIIAASTDITSRRIPNRLIAIALAGALIAHCVLRGLGVGAIEWLAGAATGLLLLLPFYLVRGMAAGDVKLMLVIGAWVGPSLATCIVLATFVAGGIGALAVVIWRGHVRRLFANVRGLAMHAAIRRQAGAAGVAVPADSVGALPYGVAIAVGTMTILFAATV